MISASANDAEALEVVGDCLVCPGKDNIPASCRHLAMARDAQSPERLAHCLHFDALERMDELAVKPDA